jgi:hypothetical protein
MIKTARHPSEMMISSRNQFVSYPNWSFSSVELAPPGVQDEGKSTI